MSSQLADCAPVFSRVTVTLELLLLLLFEICNEDKRKLDAGVGTLVRLLVAVATVGLWSLSWSNSPLCPAMVAISANGTCDAFEAKTGCLTSSPFLLALSSTRLTGTLLSFLI